MIGARSAVVPILAALGLAACGSTPALPPPPRAPPSVTWPAPLGSPAAASSETPDAPFRDHVPEPGPPIVFHAPRIEPFALSNGIRVLFVERHELPLVSLRVVEASGASDMALRPGEAALLGALIEQGTLSRGALAISDAFAAMGAKHATWVDWDSGQITIEVLASQMDRAIDLLGDLAENASFPQGEIDRLGARWAASLRAERSSPLAAAGNATAAALYGRAHPYGHSLFGKAEDVPRATREELVHAWQRAFDPANVTLVAAGDTSREALAQKLEKAFGSWRSGARPPKRGAGSVPPPPPPKPVPARLVLVDHPGAPQSQVAIAEPGVPFGALDRDAVAVMNAILGGMFSSHVNLNLREAHAFTYDARTRFAQRRGPGPFVAGGAVLASETAPAVKELLLELEAIRDRDVTPEELADAKEFLSLALPARFETLDDVTSAIADLAIFDLPADEYASRPARFAAVTAADVRRAAQAHLHPSKMKVVIVGDARLVEPSLRELGLGPPAFLDAYGEPAAGR